MYIYIYIYIYLIHFTSMITEINFLSFAIRVEINQRVARSIVKEPNDINLKVCKL